MIGNHRRPSPENMESDLIEPATAPLEMKPRGARAAAQVVVGLVFLASGLLKAMDVQSFSLQISHFGILRDPVLVNAAAVSLIVLETLIGAALVAGFTLRGWLHRGVIALLILFTGLLAYGWIFKNIQDCGCFGSYVKMSPGISISKNIVLIALTAYSAIGLGAPGSESFSGEMKERIRSLRGAGSFAASILVLLAALHHGWTPAMASSGSKETKSGKTDHDRPFAQFQFSTEGKNLDLGKGKYFVAMLSASCSHCEAAVGELNELARFLPNLPPIVALCLGEEDTLTEFRAKTHPEFPTFLVPPLKFFEFIGDAPPRFILVSEGKQTGSWDHKIPEDTELLELLR